MTKYYRVIKENPLWEVGAILANTTHDDEGYEPIEDVWNLNKDQTEYLTSRIVENQSDFFERVYKSQANKTLFVTAEVLKKSYEKMVK